ncbi:MAG: AsnC family protein [Candidatus Puniceispirillaceae bacterium]
MLSQNDIKIISLLKRNARMSVTKLAAGLLFFTIYETFAN